MSVQQEGVLQVVHLEGEDKDAVLKFVRYIDFNLFVVENCIVKGFLLVES